LKKYYVCGPMTGLPQFNIPLFDAVTKLLRAEGHAVVSPAELDSPEMRALALASPDGKMPSDGKMAGETWGDVLARDVKLIHNEIDAIAVLPDWQKSRGARLECFVGLLCNKEFYGVDTRNGLLFPVSSEYIRSVMRENMP
jgi:hypothetical protein